MTIDTGVGQGTTFEIRFPLDTQPHNQRKTEPNLHMSSSTNSQGNVLILDDEELVLIPMQAGPEDLGFSVRQFTSPVEALKCFQENPQDYDLIISDVTMPEMNGFQFSSKIREERKDLPILISTGYNQHLNTADICRLGKADFLYKPFPFEELENKIRELLGE